MWNQSLGSSGCWTPRFSRNLNDWEIDIVEQLLLRLKDKTMIGGREDMVL